MSWGDRDLTFDLVIVSMSFKILSGLFFDSMRCSRLTLGMDIGYQVYVCIWAVVASDFCRSRIACEM